MNYTKIIKYLLTLLISLNMILIYHYSYKIENKTSVSNMKNVILSKTLSENDSCIRYEEEFSIIIDDEKYPKITPQYYNKSIDFKCLERLNTANKTILLWTNFNGVPLQDSLKQKIIDKPSSEVLKELNCPVTNCHLTYDRKRYNESSLVLFHMRNRIDYYPSHRSQNQRWVN